MNENGQKLLEFCCHRNLCVTNTLFQNKLCHRASWRHPRSKHWHQLDLIITRRGSLNSVKHSADCDTDHSLVISNIKIKPKKLHTLKRKCQTRIDASKASCPARNQILVEHLAELLPAERAERAVGGWCSLRSAIYNAAVLAYGIKERNDADWFGANIGELEPAISSKRRAMLKYKSDPSQRNLQVLRAARKRAQQMARRCANNYWLQLSDSIQWASDSGNVRGMYEGIKRATGRPVARTALLRSRSGEPISSRTEQLSRWVEQYLDLYSNVNNVSQEALDAIENLPSLDALDAEPSVEELKKPSTSFPVGRQLEKMEYPQMSSKGGKRALLGPLHELLCLCWREGHVPQDMRDSKIITLYKNKGDRSDCNNYRGISLLSMVGKVFARVVLGRLQALADLVYPESQCGFRAQRGTSDMIFSLRQLQEKYREQRRPLYIAFIDLTKASDGKLFNLARLRAKTKVRAVLIRELLFADDAVLSSHTEEDLQRLLGCFAHACREFGLTINIRKTNVMGQDVVVPPSITMDGNQLEVAEHFTYLGSTISNNLSLDSEIDKRIAKA
ncbi:uncharacterized protein LOC108678311 [Hyalella azteca]|uniref:Uncharacterized protein LOC108678311 n=1 Tax=Hyalella azteca TaxID=294128 RepID=A0A8B7P883_HYAAZ|nr:uncharacterized protein LOC108678311 [Hyalella azteca]